MNGSYNTNNFIVRLRGLPWNTDQSEIYNFLQGCKIRNVQFLINDQGRPTGECFVSTESKEDMDLARTFDKRMMSNRYIEIFESNSDEMSQMTKTNKMNDSSNFSSANDNWREPVVRLRGLPYNSSKDDVIAFFSGLQVAQNGVHISSSKPAGEAFVAFTTMDNALRALDFNRKNMGHRYIEVFKSNYTEARASIINDTQSVARQKTDHNTARQGNYGNNRGAPSNTYNNSNNNTMNSYDQGPPPNQYDSYNGSGNNYSTGSSDNGSVKRPMSSSFTIKLRGVPFEAGQKEIFEFFNPVVPVQVDQEGTPRGRPPVWYAEFGSREEATEAMTFHKNYMGDRYIELFPLYDDLNRSKMART